MHQELSEHGRTKFPCSGLIATSAGRDWNGIHAERRQHPAGELPPHVGAVTEITYALGGNPLSSVLRTGHGQTQSTVVRDGTIWISPEGVSEGATKITRDLPDILHVCLPSRVFAALSADEFPRLTPAALRYAAGVEDPLIAYMVGTVAAELARETSSGGLLVETIALALGAHLALRHADSPTYRRAAHEGRHGLDQRRLRRVLDHIDANLETNLSVENLAEVACLSQFHFSRAFKRATGMSPYGFVSHRRLELAKALLAKGDRSLIDIAFACNFSTQASFTKAFTRSVGVSPGRYRIGGP